MNIGELRELITSHARSTQVLSALGLALEARLNGALADGEVAARTKAVVDALGAAAALRDASPAELTPMLATIRSELLMGGRLMSDGSNVGGWQQSEDRLHQAFGDLSAGFGQLLRTRISRKLPGLPRKPERARGGISRHRDRRRRARPWHAAGVARTAVSSASTRYPA